MTMPYAMAVLGSGLMDEYFRKRTATLGEIVLNAKRQMADECPERTDRKTAGSAGQSGQPQPQAVGRRAARAHDAVQSVWDPLMRMHYPKQSSWTSPTRRWRERFWKCEAPAPLSGTGIVELVCRRDQLRKDPPPRHRYENSPKLLNALNTDLCAGQQSVLVAAHVMLVTEGDFLTAVKIPLDARGACHMRVFLEDETGQRYALGAHDIQITAPRTPRFPCTPRYRIRVLIPCDSVRQTPAQTLAANVCGLSESASGASSANWTIDVIVELYSLRMRLAIKSINHHSGNSKTISTRNCTMTRRRSTSIAAGTSSA